MTWTRLAVVFGSTWSCRHGFILGNLKCHSNSADPRPKLVSVGLFDFKESSLGNVLFKRLNSPQAAQGYYRPQKALRRTLPARKNLPPPPPPPAKAPPRTITKILAVGASTAQTPSVLNIPLPLRRARAHLADFTALMMRVRSQVVLWVVSFCCGITNKLREAASSTVRAVGLVLQTLGVRELPLRPGMSRVRWRCSCGSRLYDDFIEVRPGAAKALEEHLNDHTCHGTVENPSQKDAQSSKATNFSMNAIAQSPTNIRPLVPRPSQTRAHAVRRQHAQRAPNFIDIGPEGRWLLVCAQAERYPTSLTQLNVCSTTSDREVFTELKRAYTGLKSRMARIFSLRAVKSIRFVQFELHLKDFVDIRKVPDVPPDTKKDEYLYQPCDLIPPVGEHLMTHLFHHPEDANDQRAITFLRTPKKRKQKLVVCPQQGTSIGWGIHLVEGWALKRIWLLALCFFLIGSVVFAICWSILEKDLQGAFGVSAYVVALVGLLVGTLHAHIS